MHAYNTTDLTDMAVPVFHPAGIEVVPGGPLRKKHNRVAVPGLHASLRKYLWPDWVHWTATRSSQKGSSRTEGLEVEAQVTAALQTGVVPDHPYACDIVAWIREENLELVGVQIPVYDPLSEIGTRLDFLLRDRISRDLVVVELKVGYNCNLTKAQGTFPAQLSEVPLTVLNQCYAQLAWTLQVMKDVYSTRACGVLLIVNQRRFDVRTFPAPLARKLRPLLTVMRLRSARHPSLLLPPRLCDEGIELLAVRTHHKRH